MNKVSFFDALKRSFCGVKAFVPMLSQSPLRTAWHFILFVVLTGIISGFIAYQMKKPQAEALGEALQTRFGAVCISPDKIEPLRMPSEEDRHFMLLPGLWMDYFDSDTQYESEDPFKEGVPDEVLAGIQWDKKAIMVYMRTGTESYSMAPVAGPLGLFLDTKAFSSDEKTVEGLRNRTRYLSSGPDAGPCMTPFLPEPEKGVNETKIYPFTEIVSFLYAWVYGVGVTLVSIVYELFLVGGIGALLAFTSKIFAAQPIRTLTPYRFYFNIIYYAAFPPILCASFMRAFSMPVFGLTYEETALYGMFIYSLILITIMQRRLLVLKR